MTRFYSLVAALLSMGACATARPDVTVHPEEADRLAPTAAPPKQAWVPDAEDPPDAPAHDAYSAAECEREARRAYGRGENQWAWRALLACGERHDFNSLEPLLHPPWAREIASHGAQGYELVGKILVRTGLTLGFDLRRLQNAGLPLLSLRQVTDDPGLADGQYVLLRAQVGARKAVGGQELVELFEQRQESHFEGMGLGEEGQGGGGAFSPAQISRMGGAGGLGYGGTGFLGMPYGGAMPMGAGMRGGLVGPGRPYSGWPDGAPYNNDYRAVGPVYENDTIDSGRSAMLDLARFDPRLTPGVDVAVLARVAGKATQNSLGAVCRPGKSGDAVCKTEEVSSGPIPRLVPVKLWILATNEDDD